MGLAAPGTFKKLASIGCEIALDMTGLGPNKEAPSSMKRVRHRR